MMQEPPNGKHKKLHDHNDKQAAPSMTFALSHQTIHRVWAPSARKVANGLLHNNDTDHRSGTKTESHDLQVLDA